MLEDILIFNNIKMVSKSKRRILRANDHVLNVLCHLDSTIPYVCNGRIIPVDDMIYLVAKFVETGNDVDTIVKDLYDYIDDPDGNVEMSEIMNMKNNNSFMNMKESTLLCALGFVFAIVLYLSIIEALVVNV